MQTLDAPAGALVDAAACTGNGYETSRSWTALLQRVAIRLAYPPGAVRPKLPVHEDMKDGNACGS